MCILKSLRQIMSAHGAGWLNRSPSRNAFVVEDMLNRAGQYNNLFFQHDALVADRAGSALRLLDNVNGGGNRLGKLGLLLTLPTAAQEDAAEDAEHGDECHDYDAQKYLDLDDKLREQEQYHHHYLYWLHLIQ